MLRFFAFRPLPSVLRLTSRARAYWLGAVVCAVAALVGFPLDIELSEWARDAKIPGEARRLIFLAEVVGAGSGVIWIVMLVGLLDRRPWLGWVAGVQAFGAGLVANVIKMTVARQRPWSINWPELPRGMGRSYGAADTFVGWLPPVFRHDWLTSAYQSFPSGHTATAVGLATFLSVAYPRGRWIFCSLAVLAAVQRIVCQAHFPSDVLAGACVGFGTAAVNEMLGWNNFVDHPLADE